VTAFDENCDVLRTLTTNTNSSGQVPDDTTVTPNRPMIGLPFSDDYDICALNTARTRRFRVSNVALTSSGTTGTPLNIYLGATGGTSGTGLTCP
jgi:hypothetical protein